MTTGEQMKGGKTKDSVQGIYTQHTKQDEQVTHTSKTSLTE